MKYAITLSLLLVTNLFGTKTLAQKRALLLQKLLDINTEQNLTEQTAYLPLKINGSVHDEIYFKIDADQNVYIKQNTFNYILTQLKDPYKSKFNMPKSTEFITLKSLKQLGIQAYYDEFDVCITIEIPIKIKIATPLLFNSRSIRNKDGSIMPKKISGGMNLYLNQSYFKNNEDAFHSENLAASADMFLNVYDLVLESRLIYGQKDKKVKLGRYQLLKDDVKHQFRYKLGYINLPSHERMRNLDVFGFSFEKKFEIGDNFTQNMTRRNSNEFFLKHHSRIEIYINNKYSRVLNLDSGSYNLYDLHLDTGLNKIKLKITEDGGKVEWLEFDDFSYTEILEKGQICYGLGLGYKSDQTQQELDYDKDKKVASAYVEYGLLDALTIKSGLQKIQDSTAASLEVLWGTSYGLINPYILMNKNSDKDTKGYKKGVHLRTNIGPVRLSFSYEKIDEEYSIYDFYTINFDNQNISYSELYHINIATSIGYSIVMGLSASSYKNEDGKETKYNARFYKNFDNNIRAELELEKTKTIESKTENKIYFRLSYAFDNDYNADYSTELDNNSHNLNLAYDTPGTYGVNTGVRWAHNKKSNNYHTNLNYKDEKFNINTTYGYTDYISSNKKNISYDIQLATGLVFAGTKATITAPIYSSFAIVDNDNRLEKSLGIAGRQENDAFVYDTYTVGISNYTLGDITIDETNLDFGMDLRYVNNRFSTTYKSGSILNIEIDNFYAVKGMFYDDQTKKPINKKAFKVFNTTTNERTMGFTDETGAFTINHLNKGQYNITFVHEAGYVDVARCQFEIKETMDASLIDIGNVYIDIPKKRLGIDMIFDENEEEI